MRMLPEARETTLDSDDDGATEHTCPLCEVATATRPDLRVHPEATHRKSDIVTELLDRVDGADSTASTSTPTAPSPSDRGPFAAVAGSGTVSPAVRS